MIALDAMGGDYAPNATVIGAINAAKGGIAVCLFGEAKTLLPLLSSYDPAWSTLPLSIHDCSQQIAMNDEPSRSVVKKKDASLVQAAHAMAQGKATALVSAGNSGAALAVGTLIIGRADHILRPAIIAEIPKTSGSLICLDLGATTDCKPEYLLQFAHMGAAYARVIKNIPNPKVALLSNGSEPYKGSAGVKAAYTLLHESFIHFAGNIEPKEMMISDIDVVVCDGFTGNIMLKTMQGTASLLFQWLKEEANSSLLSRIYFFLGKRYFSRIKRHTDYARRGGSLLLGVKKPVIIAHGCSSAQAIEQAIIYADRLVRDRVVERCNEAMIVALGDQKNLYTVHH